MESDPTLMCELLVGLGEVDVVGINDDGKGPLWVTVRSRSSRPVCQSCAGPVWSKGDRPVRLVDLPVFWPAGAALVAKAPLDVSRPHL